MTIFGQCRNVLNNNLQYQPYFICLECNICGVVVNTSALESRGRRFKSRSGQFLGFSLVLVYLFL